MTPRVHVVVPPGVRDPARPSGGNVYDVRVCDGLAARGWSVREVEAPGGWPDPDLAAPARLTEILTEVPDDDIVLVDGLVGSAAPEALVPAAGRVRLAVLVHMPLGHAFATAEVAEREARALAAAGTVLATSRWTQRWLVEAYGLDPAVVQVAMPGTDAAPMSESRPDGRRLLAVGPVSRGKGHDVLVAALTGVSEPWRLELVGSTGVDPETARRVQRWAGRFGERVRVSGALPRPGVSAAYARADLLIHPSRAETYGMVVAEALARGTPVVASDVGGTREALGMGQGEVPGLLVAPEDDAGLAAAVRLWLTDPALRRRLRATAAERRSALPTWDDAVDVVAAALRSPRLVGAVR